MSAKNDINVPVVGPKTISPQTERAIGKRFKQFMLDPSLRTGLGIRVLDGIWEAPKQPAVYQASDGKAWLFSDYEQDPGVLEAGGKLIGPRAQIDRMVALREAGLKCDVLAIAHELPPGWKPGQRLIPQGPKSRRQQEALLAFAKQIAAASRATFKVAGLAAQATALTAGAVAIVTAPVAAGGVAVGALAGAAASASTAVLTLDPIVYGGVEKEGGVKWAELARWNWE